MAPVVFFPSFFSRWSLYHPLARPAQQLGDGPCCIMGYCFERFAIGCVVKQTGVRLVGRFAKHSLRLFDQVRHL